MLELEIEYKRGILFVRLFGELNRRTSKNLKILDSMIERAGIKYLLINLEKVSILYTGEFDKLVANYKKLLGSDGKLLICGNNDSFKLKIDVEKERSYIIPNHENSAFNFINI